MKKAGLYILAVILIAAAVVRFIKLDQVPPSLNWDEVAAGYNAYTIANWGADEYGNKFPIVFKSFGDDKHPVHIYLTALIVKVFGLSDFSARAGSAAIGVFSVAAIYFLAKKLFRSEEAGLFAALFLAVSPYHIHYSRGLWEANFALFFFILGITLFLYGVDKKNWMLPASFASFGLSFFSYHSAKVVVPPVVLVLCILHFKKIFENKKILIACVLVGLILGALVIKNPRILGLARVDQTSFSKEQFDEYGGKFQLYSGNYKKYFTFSYLFDKGDQSSRASVKVIGEFYKIDLVLGILGIIALLLMRNWQAFAVIFLWLALSPIPGSVSTFDPSATRGIFMIGPVLLLSGNGASWIVNLFRKKWMKIGIATVITVLLSAEAVHYLTYYFTDYAKDNAIEWQYGMKDSAIYALKHPEYVKVYVDKIRQQPYIFFLFYLKTPLPDLLKTVKYDQTESSSFNTVSSFGRYNFGTWDPIESYPAYEVLYIVTPSYYSGLRYKPEFDVKKLVKYPNGNDAFYIVSGDRQW